MREKLIYLAARELGCQPDEIRQDGGKLTAPNKNSTTTQKMIELAVKENGGPLFHLTNYVPKDMPKVTGFAAQVAEVEVDPTTGGVRVLNLIRPTIPHGSQSPHSDRADRRRRCDRLWFCLDGRKSNGRRQNCDVNFRRVQAAVHRRRAAVENRISREPHRTMPFGGKAIAENPNVPKLAAIANAIADACGVRLFELPLTAEKIYWALRNKETTKNA